MPTAPLLSIGMIFKNEKRCLERCLKSLQPLREAVPCELVMADTGAEDGSREIAERYADEVFDFAWIDDFAAARNAVMDRCSGKWYLTVDSDEWLDADISELAAFLKKDQRVNFAYVIQRNYENADLKKSEAYDDFYALRMVRMSTGRRYHGAIHESFGCREAAGRLAHTILHHDGYVYATLEARKKKMRRNMKLLRQKLQKEPEDLRTLLQCIESGRLDPEFLQYVRRGVAAAQKKLPGWEVYGPCILRHAAEAARAHEQPEFEEWVEYAQKEFPDSIFTQIDLNYSAFLAAHEAKEWEKAIRYGEGYRKGLRVLRADRRPEKVEKELGHDTLCAGSRSLEAIMQVALADTYLQSGNGEKALELLTALKGETLTADQVRIAAVAFCQLHAQTELDTAPAFAAFYEQISRKEPDEAAQRARLEMFYKISAVPFTAGYQKEEAEREAYFRPAYTAFLPLAEKCEAGRAAKIMMSADPAEMRAWLLRVEDWQALPIEALEHALKAGVAFPLEEKPLPIEVLDGLAARLACGQNLAQQTVLGLAGEQEYPSLQSFYWVQGLSLAALRSFDWKKAKAKTAAERSAGGEKPKQDTEGPRPKDGPETGLALLRWFAQIEAALLPLQYTPQMLAEQNAALLPPMHRWGLYCAWALKALDAGQPQEYLALLRRGLAACPGQKEMVQFLLDRFMEDARPKASPELLALAERIRAILAAYSPDDPAVTAIRESPAYQQVAWIIEEGPVQ